MSMRRPPKTRVSVRRGCPHIVVADDARLPRLPNAWDVAVCFVVLRHT